MNGIRTNCNCSITADYIGNGQLVCFEAITFQGQIFSTDTHNDTVLLSLLHEWVSTSPMVIVEGETLQVLGNCRVELKHLGSNESYCTPQVLAVVATFPISTLLSSTAAGIVVILMVLGSIVGGYVYYRKAGIAHNKSKKRYMIRHVCTHYVHTEVLCQVACVYSYGGLNYFFSYCREEHVHDTPEGYRAAES